MTLLEIMIVLALIAIVGVAMIVARLWSVDVGLVVAITPFALMGVGSATQCYLERRELRTRIPQARLVATRRAS
jgi:uncharacterized membrane protein